MDELTCDKCGKVMTPENARQRPELFLHDACLPDELKPAAVPVDAVPAPTADDLALDVRDEYDTVQFAETHGDRLGNSAAYLRRLAAAEVDRDRLLAALKATGKPVLTGLGMPAACWCRGRQCDDEPQCVQAKAALAGR